MCAMYILCDAAKGHMKALRTLQGLAQGSKPVPPPDTQTTGRPTGQRGQWGLTAGFV